MVIHEGLWKMDNTYAVSISGFRLLERLPSQPSAKCDLETYTLFLLAESKYPGCTRLAEILEDLSQSLHRFRDTTLLFVPLMIVGALTVLVAMIGRVDASNFHQIGCLFSNHNCGCICVSCGDSWHNRCINNS